MKRRIRTYSGLLTSSVQLREINNRAIARAAAAEGIVLLENDGLLPIRAWQKAAVYGSGVAHIIKGGTGSGDVNVREIVSIPEGLRANGVEMTNGAAALAAQSAFDADMKAWGAETMQKLGAMMAQKAAADAAKEAGEAADAPAEDAAPMEAGSDMNFLSLITPPAAKASDYVPIVDEEVRAADLVIYVISRTSGEGMDRKTEQGDYYLSEDEQADLEKLVELSDRIAVVINAGGQMDLALLRAIPQVRAIVIAGQGGMEAGAAIADVLCGKVTPSGKLTNTWPVRYEDIPCADTFSHNDGNVETEKYEEGIYVGYRYFDSFGVAPAYPFGFGRSYTTFSTEAALVEADGRGVTVRARVTNTGTEFAGKQVVQIYAALPQGGLKKEYQRLAGFAKTRLLAPGESQELCVTIPAETFASFNEAESAWIIESGTYYLLAGDSSADTALCGTLFVQDDVMIEPVRHILPLQQDLNEIVRPDDVIERLHVALVEEAAEKGITAVEWEPEARKQSFGKAPAATERQKEIDEKASAVAAALTKDEIIALLMGEITKGQDNLKDNELVETGIYVPGAAGETTCVLEQKYDIPAISIADGPAGLRLQRSYDVDRASGKIYSTGMLSTLTGGLLSIPVEHPDADTYYMYATGIPVGSLLAQSWDPALLEDVGRLVAEEMHEFGVAWWLAPGMNIHRNPLCGRNFEYYSEDPLIAGVMAAAITRGVQSVPGVGTTIKHYAANNQEDNRTGADSVMSERTLREIYLREFEIAIRTSQPMCIMTSYNLINGVHTANSYDLCTVAARKEWGFDGIIMTDWTTTSTGGSTPHKAALAGNDLIMPGSDIDVADIRAALESGDLPEETARECCRRLLRTILQTTGMEDAVPYGERFGLKPYLG